MNFNGIIYRWFSSNK